MTEQSPVEAIFFAALEKGTAEERVAYLDAACGADSNLRQRVERLLAAHPQVGSFLEPPAEGRVGATEAETTPPTGVEAGAVIDGRYKLLQPIGEGGMGSVWMAQQTNPVTRMVAVKLIKAGMDSNSVLARFEAERQALAVMDHPNIAKVLDGGTTEAGRPFFVMELVKGTPITRYCDEHRLPLRQRLELFVCVCQALQHAHQKGIVHRDLKPSNVLVAPYDGKPVPKVIDFGVAKATGPRLTERTLFTEFGAIIGTLQYMSPEQAELNNLDIDTRSDIYSLGVLLYELLTGTTPLDMNRLHGAAMAAVLMAIHDDEPPKPSTRLSQSTASLPSIAAQRQTEPAKLTKLLRGELDWIVMKALEKDRNRRYETANALARDLERYLHDEVVEARPPTAGYRLRKFVRKHRTALTTVAAFVGLLIVAAIFSGWLAVKARQAEALSETRRQEAEANSEKAEENFGYAVNATSRALIALATSEINQLSLQVDLDLAEARADPRRGLLRLARPMKTKTDELDTPFMGAPESKGNVNLSSVSSYRSLREFVTAAVLAAGQDYAPLLPPMSHEPADFVAQELGPDGKLLLTLSDDGIARLWDLKTAHLKAMPRESDELVVAVGFSPDGRSFYTSDTETRIRIWTTATGGLQSKVSAPIARIAFPPGMPLKRRRELASAARNIVLADRNLFVFGIGLKDIVEDTDENSNPRKSSVYSSAECFDAATGRLVTRLDRTGHILSQCKLAPNGRWLTMIEDQAVVRIVAADSGAELGRLSHPAGNACVGVAVSPRGTRMITSCLQSDTKSPTLKWVHRLWEPEPWHIVPELNLAEMSENETVEFINEAALQIRRTERFENGAQRLTQSWWRDVRIGHSGQKEFQFDGYHFGGAIGTRRRGEEFYDATTFNRLLPAPGGKYPAALTGYAADGRFVLMHPKIIDTITGKDFEFAGRWTAHDTPGFIPGFGSLILSMPNVHVLPDITKLDVPADLLELWAQVAVRGELGTAGEFVPWNEPTWEKKRQELAAKPAPYPDFPFPGRVATDKLHWLRQEYESASDANKPGLAKQLLDRAEAVGDKAEAVRWRAIVSPESPPAKPASKPSTP